MTPNQSRHPAPLPFTVDRRPPALSWPALPQQRDPRVDKPEFVDVADQAEPAATLNTWPRIFPGL